MRKLSFWKRKRPAFWLSSRAWKNAGVILLALPVLSCRTTKENTSMSLRDSLEWSRKVSVTLATIPTSLAELAIPMDSLRRLPEGAAYAKRSGQATARVAVAGDTLVVTAECDSLQRVVYSLEEELRRASARQEQSETIKEAPEFTLKCYWTGIMTGIISLLTYQFIRKWRRQDR